MYYNRITTKNTTTQYPCKVDRKNFGTSLAINSEMYVG